MVRLLASDVRALIGTLEDDERMREMEKSGKSPTSGSDESEPPFKKARRSRVKPPSKKFVTDSCSEDADDVVTERFAPSKGETHLSVSRVPGRQSRVVMGFRTARQTLEESMQDGLRRSEEAPRECDDDEDDDEEVDDEGDRDTLDGDDAMDASERSFEDAVRSLRKAQSERGSTKSQTLSTARRRIEPETERSGHGRPNAHCATCTCSSSPAQ